MSEIICDFHNYSGIKINYISDFNEKIWRDFHLFKYNIKMNKYDVIPKKYTVASFHDRSVLNIDDTTFFHWFKIISNPVTK